MNKTWKSLKSKEQIDAENKKLIENRMNQFLNDLYRLGADINRGVIDLRSFKNKDGEITIGKNIEMKLQFINQHGKYRIIYPKAGK